MIWPSKLRKQYNSQGTEVYRVVFEVKIGEYKVLQFPEQRGQNELLNIEEIKGFFVLTGI